MKRIRFDETFIVAILFIRRSGIPLTPCRVWYIDRHFDLPEHSIDELASGAVTTRYIERWIRVDKKALHASVGVLRSPG